MPDTDNVPKHILGELLRAHSKTVRAGVRARHGRMYRHETYVTSGGYVFTVGKNKWTTAEFRWARRFSKACARLAPYDVWKPVEAVTAECAP